METMLGLLIWGGLLMLVSRWVLRWVRGPSPTTPVVPTRPAPASSPSPVQPASDASARESGALVDGLIIGHHVTRTHDQDRLDEQAETIDALRTDAVQRTYLGGDDQDDLDVADELDRYGMIGLADGFGDSEQDEFDELDGFGLAADAWDDDLSGHDDE